MRTGSQIRRTGYSFNEVSIQWLAVDNFRKRNRERTKPVRLFHLAGLPLRMSHRLRPAAHSAFAKEAKFIPWHDLTTPGLSYCIREPTDDAEQNFARLDELIVKLMWWREREGAWERGQNNVPLPSTVLESFSVAQ